MKLHARLRRLEQNVTPPAPPTPVPAGFPNRPAVINRWLDLVEDAVPLLSPDQEAAVDQAHQTLASTKQGPFGDWVYNLLHGCCRIPELSAGVMRDLLMAWLSPEADKGMVYQGCGLEYPHHRFPPLSQWRLLPGKRPQEGPPPWYDLPAFFHACPHCGTDSFQIDWPHLTSEKALAWKEMDGFAGVREAQVTGGLTA